MTDRGTDVRMLLDGLEVASIGDLRATLLQARRDAAALDALAELLRQPTWPGGADFLAWTADHVRGTGRDLTTPAAGDLHSVHHKLRPDTPRDATAAELEHATAGDLEREPDGVLDSIVAGDLDATERTRHLAQAELDYRRRHRR